MAQQDRSGEGAGGKSAPQEATPPPSKTSDRWWLPLAILAAAFAVVIVLATTALLLSPRSGRTPEPSLGPWPVPVSNQWCADTFTPEDAVEDWATAVEVGDYGGADACLSSRLLASGITSKSAAEHGQLLDLFVVDSAIDTSSGSAGVSVEAIYEDPAGPTRRSYTVQVVREDGLWKLDDLPAPGL